MKIQIVSDIHLEHLDSDEFHLLIDPSAPVLVMSGDISTFDCVLLPSFLDYISKNFVKVFWILGNHEYYNNKGFSMHFIKDKLCDMCPNNITVLDNETYIIEDYVFIGSTLWSKICDKNKEIIEKSLNDFRHIFKDHTVNITSDDFNEMHNNCINFIDSSLNRFSDKKIIIITHYPPLCDKTISEEYLNSPLKSAFCSDLDINVAKPNILFWISGHTHHNYNLNFQKSNIRLVSNQFGYEGDHTGLFYKFDFTLEI